MKQYGQPVQVKPQPGDNPAIEDPSKRQPRHQGECGEAPKRDGSGQGVGNRLPKKG